MDLWGVQWWSSNYKDVSRAYYREYACLSDTRPYTPGFPNRFLPLPDITYAGMQYCDSQTLLLLKFLLSRWSMPNQIERLPVPMDFMIINTLSNHTQKTCAPNAHSSRHVAVIGHLFLATCCIFSDWTVGTKYVAEQRMFGCEIYFKLQPYGWT